MNLKYVTKLGRGVLGQPDPEHVWKSHIDALPLSAWNGKVLNVGAGFGTEAKLAAKRLHTIFPEQRLLELNRRLILIDKYESFTTLLKLTGFLDVQTVDFIQWIKNERNMNILKEEISLILTNPPWNKNGSEPVYYEFLRLLSQAKKGATIICIVPIGFLTGPNAHEIRTLVFERFCISKMTLLAKDAFEGAVTQPSVVITATVGAPTTTFVFERTFADLVSVVTVNTKTDILQGGLPLYITNHGKELIHASTKFPTKFAMKKKAVGPCVLISDANRTTELTSNMTLCQYLHDSIRGFRVSAQGEKEKKNRNFHPCNTSQDSENLFSWCTSFPGRLILAMWATSHRNTGSNLGQLPAIIVPGTYSDEKALDLLGVSPITKAWCLSFKLPP